MSINRPNGPSIDIRLVRPHDEPALRTFLATLDRASMTRRFPSTLVNPTALAREIAGADGRRRQAVVALVAGETIVGLADWTRSTLDGELAEVGAVTAGGHRGAGLEETLLAALDARAA